MQFQKTAIGEIPLDWKVVKLSDVALPEKNSIVDGPFGSQMKVSEYVKEGIPLIEMHNLSGDGFRENFRRFITEEKFNEVQRSGVKPDDIVLSKTGTLGLVAIVPRHIKKAIITSRLAKISPDYSKVVQNYLYHSLIFLRLNKYWDKIGEGSTMKILTIKKISNALISLPPLLEQQKIAEILTTSDQSIQKSNDIIAKTESLKKGMMQKLLTEGIEHDEFKDTAIGKIPDRWELSPLKKIINLKSGQYFKFSEFCDEGVKCLKIDNVGFGTVEWDTRTYLPENYLDQYPELVLNEGDIVIALNRPIIRNKLKIGILKQTDAPSILYQRVGKLVFNDMEVDKNYLFFYLKGEYFKNQLSRYLIGTDQPYIRTPVFLGIKIPLPPLSEQERIAEVMSNIDAKLNKDIKRKERLQNIKKGLMNDLLTGRKQVQVNF